MQCLEIYAQAAIAAVLARRFSRVACQTVEDYSSRSEHKLLGYSFFHLYLQRLVEIVFSTNMKARIFFVFKSVSDTPIVHRPLIVSHSPIDLLPWSFVYINKLTNPFCGL